MSRCTTSLRPDNAIHNFGGGQGHGSAAAERLALSRGGLNEK